MSWRFRAGAKVELRSSQVGEADAVQTALLAQDTSPAGVPGPGGHWSGQQPARKAPGCRHGPPPPSGLTALVGCSQPWPPLARAVKGDR